MPDEEVVSGANIGTQLKSAREAKGVTLDEASRVTKIGKNYLAAIEEGAFDKLPNPAYLKGFLRLYATYLGLSGDEIIARYQQSLTAPPPAPSPSAQGHPHDPSAMGVERVKFRGHRRWGIPLVLLVLVIIAAVIYSQTEEKREYPPPPPVRPAPAPAVVPPPVQPRVSSAHPAQPPAAQPSPPAQPGQPPQPGQPVAPVPQPGTPGAAPAPPGATAPATPPPAAAAAKEGAHKGVILKLRFNKDTWLNITIDGSITQRYDLKAGDVIEWKGARAFTVDLGDGGAVEGEFNGKPFYGLGERGKPAHVELKAQ